MLISDHGLIELLFAEFNKKMLPGKHSAALVKFFSMLQEHCLASADSINLIALDDFEIELASNRYVSVMLNEFDCYFERYTARQNRLQKIFYAYDHYRIRQLIIAAQELLGRFLVGLDVFSFIFKYRGKC